MINSQLRATNVLTFHEVALKRVIFKPDDWIDQCLYEAVTVQMPHAL